MKTKAHGGPDEQTQDGAAEAAPLQTKSATVLTFCANSAELEFDSSMQRRSAKTLVCKTPSCVALTTENREHSGRKTRKRDALFSATHHYLDLAFAHLQVVLIVDVHPLQGAAHPLVHSHQEHNCKSTWKV